MRIENASETLLPRSGATRQHELTPQEQKEVDKLEKRDREVRRHERAHKAAAGSFAIGGPAYEYSTGPDGKRYAVGGEVRLDTSKLRGDPAATVRKMRSIRRAALAPAEPSPSDRSVATEATRKSAEAEREIRENARKERGSLIDTHA